MLWCVLGVPAVLLAAAPAPREGRPALPKVGLPPEVVVAHASQKGGAVQLRFFLPVPTLRAGGREGEAGGKKIKQEARTFEYGRWPLVDLEADGQQVRAF